MKKGLAITIISVLAVVAIALGALYYTNNDSKTKEIETLTSDVAERDSLIKGLNADVSAKEGEIEALNADVADKNGQIEVLNADVADRDGQIEALTADVADRDGQIEALTADVADRDGQIEALNADVADRNGQIEALNADVADRDGQIEALNTDAAEKANQIETLTADIEQKTEQNKDLIADAVEKDKTIKVQETEIAQMSDEIESLSGDIAVKDTTIAALNESVSAKDKEIETLKKEKDTQAGEIDSLTADVAAKDKEIEALNAAVASKTDTISSLEASVKDLEQQVENITAASAVGKNFSEMTDAELQSVVGAARNETLLRTAHKEDAVFIVDDPEGIQMYLTGSGQTGWSDEYELEVIVINNGNKMVGISFDNIVINGWKTDSWNMITDLGAGNKKKDTISLRLKDAGITRIDQVEDLVISLHTYDSDSYNTLKEYNNIKVFYNGKNWTGQMKKSDTAANDNGIEGTWELVDATSEAGGEDFAAAMAQLKEMGGTVTLTFKDGIMTMSMEVMGISQTQDADYEYKDGKLISEGTILDVIIDGDKLTLTDGVNSMVLQRVGKGTSSTGKTNCSVNLREGPSSKDGIIKRIANETKVVIVETVMNDKGEAWYKVEVEDKTGYLKSEFVNLD